MSAKVRSRHDSPGPFKDVLDGWQGSIDAFFVRDDVKVLLVLMYIEFHMDGNLFAHGGHLVNLRLLRHWSILAVAGASPLALAYSLAVCLIRPRLTSGS